MMIACVAGSKNAPPTPCRQRLMIIQAAEWLSPQNAEASAKIATDKQKAFLRPQRSPSFPPASTRTARTSVYALITHCSPKSEIDNSRCRVGKTTGSTVISTKIIDIVVVIAIKIHHLRFASLIICPVHDKALAELELSVIGE